MLFSVKGGGTWSLKGLDLWKTKLKFRASFKSVLSKFQFWNYKRSLKFMSWYTKSGKIEFWVPVKTFQEKSYFKLLTLWRRNYFFLILAHPVCKMWIIQEPNKLALWNKLHFEEKENEEYRACLKYSVPIFVE